MGVKRQESGASAIIDGPVAALLSSGHALSVAIANPDRVPYATRGWSLTVLSARPIRVRLVLSSDDRAQLQEIPRPRAMALTAGDPLTLHAVQFKGRAGDVEPATDADRMAVVRFCDGFFGAVREADGTERHVLERLVPPDFVACTVEIDEVYDQTPGPAAGAALTAGGS
jgi:hypothetical protein